METRFYLFLICSLTVRFELSRSLDNNVQELLTYNIEYLSDPVIESMITDSAKSIALNSYFKIPNFLNEKGVSLIRDFMLNEMKSSMIYRDVWKSLFGDQGDYINFPNDTHNRVHPRNILGNLRVSTIPKSDLSQTIINIYEYNPFLLFLRKIITSTDIYEESYSNYNNLYLSKDVDGSVYTFLYKNGEGGEWHLDQHPFSCVLMIIKPDIGGRMLYYNGDKPRKIINKNGNKSYKWNWKIIEKILKNETVIIEKYIDNINANPGDLSCFKGNETIHITEDSFGDNEFAIEQNSDIIRGIVVMTFADTDDFKHSPHVEELNAWGQNKNTPNICQGNKNCVSSKFEL